jgi:hypothetical protein
MNVLKHQVFGSPDELTEWANGKSIEVVSVCADPYKSGVSFHLFYYEWEDPQIDKQATEDRFIELKESKNK